jgi:hypothetical protein
MSSRVTIGLGLAANEAFDAPTILPEVEDMDAYR